MSSWHSYPKIYNMGHAAITDLFADPVVVEEKVDGSQFSFGIFDGVLRCKSKSVELDIEKPEKMFQLAIASVKSIATMLTNGWTYRAEYLQKPKHNTLCYNRVPTGFLAVFDINTGEEKYLPYAEKKAESERLGLEVVPQIDLTSPSVEAFQKALGCESFLGGQLIEGIVVKNYSRFGIDKKVLMGKHVSEAFKETHKGAWKEANPTQGDIIELLGHKYRTPARWQKAVQHLQEKGSLTGTPADIGALMEEARLDLHQECAQEIKEDLFNFAWPKVQRAIVRGLPEWYKNELLKKQFAGDGNADA